MPRGGATKQSEVMNTTQAHGCGPGGLRDAQVTARETEAWTGENTAPNAGEDRSGRSPRHGWREHRPAQMLRKTVLTEWDIFLPEHPAAALLDLPRGEKFYQT